MEYQKRERILPGEMAPTPDQLRDLAHIGVSSAARRSSLKRLASRATKASSSEAKERKSPPVFFAAETGLELDEEGDSELLRKLTARVGVRRHTETGKKTWTLKWSDIQHQRTVQGRIVGERTTYVFEWSKTRVELARRSLQAFNHEKMLREVDGVDAMDRLMNEISQFHVDDDVAQQWQLELNMEEVTRADCDWLIDDARQYFSQVDDEFVERQARQKQRFEQDKPRAAALRSLRQLRADDDRVDEQMWRGEDPDDE